MIQSEADLWLFSPSERRAGGQWAWLWSRELGGRVTERLKSRAQPVSYVMEPNGQKKSESKSTQSQGKYHIKAEMENSYSGVHWPEIFIHLVRIKNFYYSYEILEGFPGMLCSHPFKKSYEQTKKSTCKKFFALNSVLLLFLNIKRWRLMNTIVRCACFLVRATFGWGQANAYERIRSTDIREKMKTVKCISCCW